MWAWAAPNLLSRRRANRATVARRFVEQVSLFLITLYYDFSAPQTPA